MTERTLMDLFAGFLNYCEGTLNPGLDINWVVGGMAAAISALATAISVVAGKLYRDLKEARKELAECQAARVAAAEEHARELLVLKSMIEGRRRV